MPRDRPAGCRPAPQFKLLRHGCRSAFRGRLHGADPAGKTAVSPAHPDTHYTAENGLTVYYEGGDLALCGMTEDLALGTPCGWPLGRGCL